MVTFLLLYLVLITAITIYFLNRVDRVYNYRGKLIDWIYKQPDWAEKRRLLDDPSFGEMSFKFWKRVDSFYPELKDKL